MRSANQRHGCVFGLGWGDEGKGKVVDLLCPVFDTVVRFNGGANAGHTVCVGGETFALHLLPTGALHDGVTAVIGPGVVVDPGALISELDALAARGIDVTQRLRISDRAHLVLAYHKVEDSLSERKAGRHGRIGTTTRGIGPCYADKMKRTPAVRFADLLHDPDLPQRVRRIVLDRRALLSAVYGCDIPLDPQTVLDELDTAKRRLGDYVCDTTQYLQEAVSDGRAVLFEGANGLLLDVDHGTYPFVTSSSTGPHGVWTGAGVSPLGVSLRIGTVKSYATRVGSGPFVSELRDDIGDQIRSRGHEYGTTTGRPRRCGWFDAVASSYAARLSSVTDVALMHLDTLSGFERLGICVGYQVDGGTLTTVPADARRLEQAEPVIEFLPGWQEALRSIRRFEDLPAAAKRYIDRIEALIGAPVTIIGVGPDRSQTLVRGDLQSLIHVPEPTAA